MCDGAIGGDAVRTLQQILNGNVLSVCAEHGKILTAPLLLFEVGELRRSARGALPGPGGDSRYTHARAQIPDCCATAPIWFNAHSHVDGAGGYRPVALTFAFAEFALTHRRPADAGGVEVCFGTLILAQVRPLFRRKWHHFIPPLTEVGVPESCPAALSVTPAGKVPDRE